MPEEWPKGIIGLMDNEKPLEGVVGYWDSQWKTVEGREPWSTPESYVAEAIASIAVTNRTEGARALDMGSGTGRHARLLAESGYAVAACDASPAAVKALEEMASALGLPITAARCDMRALPYEDSSFDLAIAWNVIYHGSRAEITEALRELRRVLRPSGILIATLLPTSNAFYGKGRRIDEHCFAGAVGGDRAHPHCYLSREEALEELSGFEVIDFIEADHGNYPGAWHWRIKAVKL
jgi:SAM-dependent methyltransferase